MRTTVLIVIIVVAVVIVAAGAWFGVGYALNRGTGPVVSEDRDVPMFTQVDLSGEGTLIITSGNAPQLRIEAQQNVLDRLETTVSDDTLTIRLRWGWLGFGPFWGSEPITYYLTAPDLRAIELSGSTAVLGESPFDAEEFVVDCSGSSDIEVNVSEQLTVNASGSSTVSYIGDPALNTDISGSGEVRRLEQ